jgi:hypothetical protein
VASRLTGLPVGELLDQTYSSWVAKHAAGLPLSLLPVWIQIHTRFPGLSLNPNPIADAVRRVSAENLNETGLRLTCHKLLEHWNKLGEYKSAATDRIVDLLYSARHWHEWHLVAGDAFAKTQDRRFFGLIAEWLEQVSEENSSWILVWEALWRRGMSQDRITLKTRYALA